MSHKRLTVSNWGSPDPVSVQFATTDEETGAPVLMDGDVWAREFLAVTLDTTVPEDVRELFDVARGTCLYGWFFYPLYTLGRDQLFRAVEAAARARYQELRPPDGHEESL